MKFNLFPLLYQVLASLLLCQRLSSANIEYAIIIDKKVLPTESQISRAAKKFGLENRGPAIFGRTDRFQTYRFSLRQSSNRATRALLSSTTDTSRNSSITSRRKFKGLVQLQALQPKKRIRKVGEVFGDADYYSSYGQSYLSSTHGAKQASTSNISKSSNKKTTDNSYNYKQKDTQYSQPDKYYKSVPDSPFFNDPMAKKVQWYFLLLNITGAWQQGYTGKGVTISVLDDGVEKSHPDLYNNYAPEASYDINANDNDPTPDYTKDNKNKHGTRCAGMIAAEANNEICIPGIAYNSKIGGVRMLDGNVNDMVESQSISYAYQVIDIYSSSWGPDDDGKTVDGPGPLTQQALIDGVTFGRNRKGSIYVWASGNGGKSADSCAVDGYANSIYTISISSTGENGQKPWYNEQCASTIATAYSSNSNSNKEPKIATTDLRGKCTDQHTGTSAAAPMMAGIIALGLEANPNLSWRDVQNLIIRSSSHDRLTREYARKNAVGRYVSPQFGYGLINAGKFTQLAKETTPEKQMGAQKVCKINLMANIGTVQILARDGVSLANMFSKCASNVSQNITRLEHVILKTSLQFQRRGDIEIELISPSGTRSVLHHRRPSDTSSDPFQNWPFMSIHFWDEPPFGEWKVNIKNGGNTRARGKISGLELILFGTYSEDDLSNGSIYEWYNGTRVLRQHSSGASLRSSLSVLALSLAGFKLLPLS